VPNARDNAPCATLFVGNLGPTVSVAELRALFSPLPGFVALCLRPPPLARAEAAALRGKPPPPPLCFVEFESVEAARAAHDGHNGALLASSDRGGLRLQYAARPLGSGGRVRASHLLQPQLFEGQQWVFANGGGGGGGGGGAKTPGSPSSPPYGFGFGVFSPQQEPQQGQALSGTEF